MEFKYCVNPNDEEPIMLINKHIGFDEAKGQGIIGSEFQKELLFLDSLGKKRIKIYMSTLGGSVLEGQLIYNSILKSVTKEVVSIFKGADLLKDHFHLRLW